MGSGGGELLVWWLLAGVRFGVLGWWSSVGCCWSVARFGRRKGSSSSSSSSSSSESESESLDMDIALDLGRVGLSPGQSSSPGGGDERGEEDISMRSKSCMVGCWVVVECECELARR